MTDGRGGGCAGEWRGEGVRLIQGDCLEAMRGMEPGSVDLVVTSPPYNCRKDYGTFVDEMPWPEYYEWIGKVIDELYRVLVSGGVLAINVPGVVRYQHDHAYRETWRDFDKKYKTHREGKKVMGRGRIEPVGFRIFEMMSERDMHIREPIVWVKGSQEGEAISGGYQMGSDNNPYLRAVHELILLGSKDQWYHRGGTGRRGGDAVPFLDYTKDVWFVSPSGSNGHPATFPQEIPLRLIRLFTHAEDAVVLDPFMGIGTTGFACMEAGVDFIGIEIDENFYKVAERNIKEINLQLTLWD